MPNFGAANLVWLIPALPLFGFLLAAFAGKKIGRPAIGWIATLIVFASFGVSLAVFFSMLNLPGEDRRLFASLIPGAHDVPWISIGTFRMNFTALIDPLSMLMCLIITGVGGLIHMYAIGYMAEDRDFPRFFTYLNEFIFFMLVLVLGANILLMFVGWEGVGLCSYLLISFWYEDIENSKAGNKAFIVNRIGDVSFALGMMLVFATFGTLTFYTPEGTGFLDMAGKHLTSSGVFDTGLATVIALLLFGGAVGKSAQFPLYIWLPDAMAGPTPVSALIHAATMVTAGVVMITRVSPIVVQAPVAMIVIACIGVFTAIFAASIALTQNDIKKVLAYSTVSQLGYMFLGCGVGAFAAGMFHVMTHAFFKALLFLGAGSVIHALGGEQDMRKMGGLAKRIPITYVTMAAAWLAISGIFPFSGFWSKDEILGRASGFRPFDQAYGPVLYAVGLIAALMTAFYMTRLMAKTFWTKPRFNEADLGHGHGQSGHGAQDEETTSAGRAGHGDVHQAALEPGVEDAGAAGHGGGHAGPGHVGIHESPWVMTVPLMILAVLSLVGGWIGTPWDNIFERYMEPSVARATEYPEMFPTMIGLAIGLAIAVVGIVWAWSAYNRHRETGELLSPEQKAHRPIYQGSLNLWGVDGFFMWLGVVFGGAFGRFWAAFDRGIIDGLVNAVGTFASVMSEIFRRAQTGFVRGYALVMLAGVVGVVAAILWPLLSTH